MTKANVVLGAILLAGALVPSQAAAQSTNTDPNWTPWYGCWRAEAATPGEHLCIVPEGAGVRMATVQQGEVRAETRVITDGRARRVDTASCDGTELAHW